MPAHAYAAGIAARHVGCYMILICSLAAPWEVCRTAGLLALPATVSAAELYISDLRGANEADQCADSSCS